MSYHVIKLITVLDASLLEASPKQTLSHVPIIHKMSRVFSTL